MTIRLLTAAMPALALALAAAPPAAAQETSVKMTGRCERLVIGGQDITQNCKEQFTNTVQRGRTSFDFSAWDGQTLSFAGSGAPRDASELSEALQPISLVVPGRKDKDAVVRSPSPAVGACRFTTPEPGKSQIACEATSQGKPYTAIFITDVKPVAPAAADQAPAAVEQAPAAGAAPAVRP